MESKTQKQTTSTLYRILMAIELDGGLEYHTLAEIASKQAEALKEKGLLKDAS